jgi:hypothetical protein
VLSSAPRGRAARTRASPALIACAFPVLAPANRYSIWAWWIPAGPASAGSAPGWTQACAVRVTESAMPVTVSVCPPAVIVPPRLPSVRRPITISPAVRGQ